MLDEMSHPKFGEISPLTTSNINFSSDGYSVEYPFFCIFSGRLRMMSS